MTVTPLPTTYTIGGSEVAAAVGIDPHRSPVMLWAQKLGQVEWADSEAAEWGRRLEPTVRDAVADRGYAMMPAPADGFTDPDRSWVVGHPDGFTELRGERAVLEIKTAGHFAWTAGEVPLRYQAQCQWYMHLTDTAASLLACLVAGQRLEVHEIERNQDAIDDMLVYAGSFLSFLRQGTPPPPDGSPSTRDAIRAIFPGATEGRKYRLSRAEWEQLLELRARKEALAATKEQVAEIENFLKLAMGDAETAISPHDTEAITWRNVQSRRLDVAALKAAHPDLYAEFATATTTRRFALS